MLNHQQNERTSIEQLISQLEHIEESEIQSDIRANVRAELKRIKRNVSAILAFTSHSPSADNPQLQQAVSEVRRECLLINEMISRTLILQALHAGTWMNYSSRVAEQYSAMSQAVRHVCVLTSPLRVQALADAL
jgi:hypothetical protein